MTEKAHRPFNVSYVKCSKEDMLRKWIEFLTPYHHLANRERDVFAVIMNQYFRLKSQCDDPVMVRTLLWASKSRAEMRRILNMSQPHFQMVLAKLRDRGALLKHEINRDNIKITEYDINDRYLPHITQSSRSFEYRIIFDYSTPEIKETPIDEAV